ncbi:MAG: zinc ABC transporter substrate-binding protein [Candidatus Aminicenantales bacterium]
MSKKRKESLIVWLILSIFFFGRHFLFSEPLSRIKIMATVFPLMEFAGAVAGDRGEVSLILPPGTEIHTWQPRVSDIAKFSSSDFFIYIGRELEPWVEDLLKNVARPGLRILEASQILPLAQENESSHQGHHERGAIDPHVWLDFSYDLLIVDRIQEILAEIDPGHAPVYAQNAAGYKEKLVRLDQKYHRTFKDCLHRIIIFGGHAAFGYLAERYGLQQISLYGLSPDSEPTPRRLVEVTELTRKYGIQTIFFESNINPKLTRVLARETGTRTLPLNPGANLTKAQLKSGVTFLMIMEDNLKNLRHGLRCR